MTVLTSSIYICKRKYVLDAAWHIQKFKGKNERKSSSFSRPHGVSQQGMLVPPSTFKLTNEGTLYGSVSPTAGLGTIML